MNKRAPSPWCSMVVVALSFNAAFQAEENHEQQIQVDFSVKCSGVQ